MFIHIGGDTMVWLNQVVGIFDLSEPPPSCYHELLDSAKAAGRLQVVEGGVCKSLVVTDDWIYCSPISSLTLKRRANWLEPAGKIGETDVGLNPSQV
ncbi:MAG: DUF370 domain-containing protein [Alicyclobacillus sp.]|nr:DUF370 domain-containing protein [Alicyclobacillus sp.]